MYIYICIYISIDTYTHIVVPKLRTVLEHSPTVVADAYIYGLAQTFSACFTLWQTILMVDSSNSRGQLSRTYP